MYFWTGIEAKRFRMQALLLCTAAAVAAVGSFDLAITCTSDQDCNLNGRCSSSGSCLCLSAWRGSTCGELALAPAVP